MANSNIFVPFKTDFFLEVVDFLRDTVLEDEDPVEFIAELAHLSFDQIQDDEYFETVFLHQIDRARLRYEDKDKGIIWGTVFLIDGTKFRMPYKRQIYYAQVRGDQLVSLVDLTRDGQEVLREGQIVSPSEFANCVTGTSRNAWKCLYIRGPGEADWELADRLRSRVQAIHKEFFDGPEDSK